MGDQVIGMDEKHSLSLAETFQDGVSTQQTSQYPDQANTGNRRQVARH
jgi:hypothetical protein